MRNGIYLDSAASTPLAPEAREAVIGALDTVGNPGAAHAAGNEAAMLVEGAREHVARLMRVGPASVFFTGSATESNNMALRGLASERGRTSIVTTAADHPSITATVSSASLGHQTKIIPISRSGEVNLDVVAQAVDQDTHLVSVHAANNETGVIQPLERIADIAHAAGALVHTDASQLMAWGEASFLDSCDLITVSSHKMHGPQGAAALIVKGSARGRLIAQLTGGGQEGGMRSGTPNVAAIAGFGAAAKLATESGPEAAFATATLRDQLWDLLSTGFHGVLQHGGHAPRRVPGILNVAIGTDNPGSFESEVLLARIPRLYASTGSACRAGAPEPSPVLLAMGISEWVANRSIRLSLNRYTTESEVTTAADALIRGYEDLLQLSGSKKVEKGRDE